MQALVPAAPVLHSSSANNASAISNSAVNINAISISATNASVLFMVDGNLRCFFAKSDLS